MSTSLERASAAAGYATVVDLRTRPAARAALAQAQVFRSARTAVYADEVLRRWWALATADVNELVELRIAPCRHCWGRGFRYQYRDHEMGEAQRRHDEAMLDREPKDRAEFDELGGPGYTTKRPPNPECSNCDGDGVPHAVFHDTRALSPAARMLYNGVERRADGSIKLQLRDRGFAETMLAKHLGLLPTGHKRTLSIDDMNENELEEFLTANGISVEVPLDTSHDDRGDANGGEGSSEQPSDLEAPEPADPAASERVD